MSDLTTLIEDDPILFGETFLDEGKSIGTAHAHDLKLSKNLQAAKELHHKHHAAPVAAGQTVGKRKLADVQDRTETALNSLVKKFDKGKIDASELRKRVQSTMREAWKTVFQAGLRASGVPGGGSGPGKPLVYLGENDSVWLRSGMAHETRFLNKFLNDVIEGKGTMPYATRIKMYVLTLESFYNSARVIGLPGVSVIHWVGPDDKRTCEGCNYLFKHSPYSKFNLPTVPKAGATPCLCVLSPSVAIKTKCGIVRIEDVRAGDLVWTHRRRWRLVTQRHINRSVEDHRYVVLVADNGKLIGLTDDHLVYTHRGFIPAREAARTGTLCLVSEYDRTAMPDGAVSIVFGKEAMAREGTENKSRAEKSGAASAKATSGLEVGTLSSGYLCSRSLFRLLLGGGTKKIHLPLAVGLVESGEEAEAGLRDTPQEFQTDGRHTTELEAGAQRNAAYATASRWRPTNRDDLASRKESSTMVGRENLFSQVPVREDFQNAQTGGSKRNTKVLLGKMHGTVSQGENGTDLRGVRTAVHAESIANKTVEEKGVFLLGDLLRSHAGGQEVDDPAVRLLQQEVQQAVSRYSCGAEVRTGQVLLLSSALPEGTPLYDLTVEEDHSFVVDGMVLHNSNCRDKLFVRKATAEEVKSVVENHQYTRESHIRNLRRIKFTGSL